MLPSTDILGLLSRVIGKVLPAAGNRLYAWRIRRKIKSVSDEKISILIARLSGDNPANSHHLSIVEAIKEALPDGVSLVRWPDVLPYYDGPEEISNARASKTAAKWLKSTKCQLLISGRIKSSDVVSLNFTPLSPAQPPIEALVRKPQSYKLTTESMEYPAQFTQDLGAAIAIFAIGSLNGRERDEITPAVERLAKQLNKTVQSTSHVTDPLTRSHLLRCYAASRATIFDYTGNEADLQAAIESSKSSLALLDRLKHPVDWAKQKNQDSALIARLGSITSDIATIKIAIDGMEQALQALEFTHPILRATIQMNLATAHMQIARIANLNTHLVKSLDVLSFIITDELREKDSDLWAAAQNQYGLALMAGAAADVSGSLQERAVEAFSYALEVWTTELPLQRSVVLNNLSTAMLHIAGQQNLVDWYNQIIAHLREASNLVSYNDAPRIWIIIQINTSIALISTVIPGQTKNGYKAITLLRDLQSKILTTDTEIATTCDYNLARALMYVGRTDESMKPLREAIQLFEGLLLKPISEVLRTGIQQCLGETLQQLGILVDDPDALAKSREVLETLCAKIDIERQPFVYLEAKQCLSITLRELGAREKSKPFLQRSVTLIEDVAHLAAREVTPVGWAVLQLNLAASLFELAKLDSEYSHLENSEIALGDALSVLSVLGGGHAVVQAKQLAADIADFIKEGT